MEDVDLRLRVGVGYGNCSSHGSVVVGDGDAWGWRAGFLSRLVDLLHQPVKSFSSLVVDEAKPTGEGHTEMVETDDLEESEVLVVRAIRVVIELDPRILGPLF